MVALKFTHVRLDALGLKAPDTRIHVLTDCPYVMELARNYSYNVYDLRSHQRGALKWLTVSAELLVDRLRVAYRWKAYRSLVNEYSDMHPAMPVERILILESNVMITMNTPDFYTALLTAAHSSSSSSSSSSSPGGSDSDRGGGYAQRSRDGEMQDFYYESLWIDSGAAIAMSRTGLYSFSNFLDDWFQGSKDLINTALLADVNTPLMDEANLYRLYIQASPTVRTACFDYGEGDEQLTQWHDNPAHQCLLNALQCVPMKDMSVRSLPGYEPVLFYNGSQLTSANPVSDLPADISMDLLSLRSDWKLPYCYIVSPTLVTLRNASILSIAHHYSGLFMLHRHALPHVAAQSPFLNFFT